MLTFDTSRSQDGRAAGAGRSTSSTLAAASGRRPWPLPLAYGYLLPAAKTSHLHTPASSRGVGTFKALKHLRLLST